MMCFSTMEKIFASGGGLEHRSLKLSQIKRQTDNVNGKVVACYVYTERASKITKVDLPCLINK